MAFHRFAVEDRIVYKSRKRYVVFVGGHERFTNSLINRLAWTAHDRENYKKRSTTKRSTTKRNTTKRSTSREAPQERHHKRGTTREIPQREVPRSWTAGAPSQVKRATNPRTHRLFLPATPTACVASCGKHDWGGLTDSSLKLFSQQEL